MSTVKNESAADYTVSKVSAKKMSEDEIIEKAKKILLSRMRKPKAVLTSPELTLDFLRLSISQREHEIFCVIYLDNRHSVIEIEEMFRGTIDGASVHPREVVKGVLSHNAAAVIFAHNHPSGIAEPSMADRRITSRLKDALALVDVRVLDHVIVGEGNEYTSFAEQGTL